MVGCCGPIVNLMSVADGGGDDEIDYELITQDTFVEDVQIKNTGDVPVKAKIQLTPIVKSGNNNPVPAYTVEANKIVFTESKQEIRLQITGNGWDINQNGVIICYYNNLPAGQTTPKLTIKAVAPSNTDYLVDFVVQSAVVGVDDQFPN